MTAQPLTLANATNDLKVVTDGMPAVRERLAWARRQAHAADSIVLANGGDPNAGRPGELRAMLATVLGNIDYAVSEVDTHCALVRVYIEAHPEAQGQVPPDAIEASWSRFVSAFTHAQKELNELGRVL